MQAVVVTDLCRSYGLHAWESHYVIRPNVQFFLLEGLKVKNATYGIYHPDYDFHVYRDLDFHSVNLEPLNGGHDEESIPYGHSARITAQQAGVADWVITLEWPKDGKYSSQCFWQGLGRTSLPLTPHSRMEGRDICDGK